jgi:hypothetical protein
VQALNHFEEFAMVWDVLDVNELANATGQVNQSLMAETSLHGLVTPKYSANIHCLKSLIYMY